MDRTTFRMATLDLKTLTSSLGITRILELISNCICFSLMASEGLDDFSIWIWCLFTWSFSFCTTFLILILELFGLNQQLPFSWNDFTAAYSIGATLMVCPLFVIVHMWMFQTIIPTRKSFIFLKVVSLRLSFFLSHSLFYIIISF